MLASGLMTQWCLALVRTIPLLAHFMTDLAPDSECAVRSAAMKRRLSRRTVASVQAAYFVTTAALPFASRRRFEAVTGPKLEWWLVLTVASLVGVIGSVLGLSARSGTNSGELVVLGAGSAAVLCVIDVTYVCWRRISPVYLADAAVQAALLAGWVVLEPA